MAFCKRTELSESLSPLPNFVSSLYTTCSTSQTFNIPPTGTIQISYNDSHTYQSEEGLYGGRSNTDPKTGLYDTLDPVTIG